MSRTVFAIVVVLFSLTAVLTAYYANRTSADIDMDASPLEFSGGRVQLVSDEQDVGVVPQGMPLAVVFSVANTGSETLSIRQSSAPSPGGNRHFPTISIEPGHTGEVTAELFSDELLDRGRKHVQFSTSDSANSELWLTVRGTVLWRAAAGEEEVERSVLVK
jgi:Protein of unknown function (DUF1573)